MIANTFEYSRTKETIKFTEEKLDSNNSKLR